MEQQGGYIDEYRLYYQILSFAKWDDTGGIG